MVLGLDMFTDVVAVCWEDRKPFTKLDWFHDRYQVYDQAQTFADVVGGVEYGYSQRPVTHVVGRGLDTRGSDNLLVHPMTVWLKNMDPLVATPKDRGVLDEMAPLYHTIVIEFEYFNRRQAVLDQGAIDRPWDPPTWYSDPESFWGLKGSGPDLWGAAIDITYEKRIYPGTRNWILQYWDGLAWMRLWNERHGAEDQVTLDDARARYPIPPGARVYGNTDVAYTGETGWNYVVWQETRDWIEFHAQPLLVGAFDSIDTSWHPWPGYPGSARATPMGVSFAHEGHDEYATLGIQLIGDGLGSPLTYGINRIAANFSPEHIAISTNGGAAQIHEIGSSVPIPRPGSPFLNPIMTWNETTQKHDIGYFPGYSIPLLSGNCFHRCLWLYRQHAGRKTKMYGVEDLPALSVVRPLAAADDPNWLRKGRGV